MEVNVIGFKLDDVWFELEAYFRLA